MENICGIVTRFELGGKSVFIFEEHHYALLAWAIIRRRSEQPPNLITLDHHTDTHPPFKRYRFRKTDATAISHDEAQSEKLLADLLAEISWMDNQSVLSAITKLKNDEHVSTAIQAGILDWAISINLDMTTPSREERAWSSCPVWDRGPSPRRPFTYHQPVDRIFKVHGICYAHCTEIDPDVCTRRNVTAQVVESCYLEKQLDVVNEMLASMGISNIEDNPYILDIDLDYFHSAKAMNPDCPATFHRLIRGASAITVAMERSWVRDLNEDGGLATPDSLLRELKRHIELAQHPLETGTNVSKLIADVGTEAT